TIAPTPTGDEREMVAAEAAPGQVWAAGWSDRKNTMFIDRTCPIPVLDTGFGISPVSVGQGAGVAWSIPSSDVNGHSVTDGTGMGLFDSGVRSPGSSFLFVYVAAGTYSVTDSTDGESGSVRVPVGAVPAVGTQSTQFMITWASATAPAGYQFDVQIKRPGSTQLTAWRT